MSRSWFSIIVPLAAAACSDAVPTGPDAQGGPAGPPAQLLVVSGDAQTDTAGAELAGPLVVRVLDGADRPVEGQVINFRVTAGGGAVFAGVALTDSLGHARERWTLGTVARDTQHVEARAVDTQSGEALVFATFTAVATPGAPDSLRVFPATAADSARLLGGDTLLVGDSVQLAVRAWDRHGNEIPHVVPTWVSTAPAVATVTAAGLVTGAGPGAAAIVATAGHASAAFPLVVRQPLPTSLQLVSGSGQADTIDATLQEPLVVRAVDQLGNGIGGALITFIGSNGAPTDTTAGCTCRVVVTDGQGFASVGWVLGPTAGVSTMRVVGAVPGGGAAFGELVATATVLSGAAQNLIRVAGGGSTTGLLVAARDRRGNAAAGVVIRWTILSGTGTLSPPVSVTDGTGIAGSVVSGVSGTTLVTATAPGLVGSPVVFTITLTTPSTFALDFNEDWVTVAAHADFDLTTSWTIEAWVNPRNAFGGFQHIVSKWNGGGNASYTLEVNGGRFRVAIHDGVNPTQAVESNATLANGVWQHVAATFQNGMLKLFVNGVLDLVVTNSQTPMISDRPVSFGREGPPFGGWRYDGLIDEIRIWNVTRSDAEVAAARDIALTGAEPGLVGYWRFDEGSGDVAFDATGRGHNGTLGNAAGPDANDPVWTTNAAPVRP